MQDANLRKREEWFLIGLFCAALVGHFLLTTKNWTTPFMAGQEFRQSQTAIVCYYIEQQNNFSVLYETPILGKPWVSVLLEVPIYEWSVVLLSRATGWPHFLAARTISLGCFYLALPAMYLLLGRIRLSRPRRLLILALVLTSPVYIFYSRAFLIESMELMCCAWFLLGFVRTMDNRHWGWLALTVGAGTSAALIKGTTFAVWLLPAVAYGAWMLWRDLRARAGWRRPTETLLWGLSTVVVAFLALRWWVNLTDPIKAVHSSAWIFTSTTLSQGNWGIVDLTARLSPKLWRVLAERWQETIMAPWVIVAFLLGGLVVRDSAKRWSVGMAVVFFAAQLLFPFAYAYQDYYFYACAAFLLAAIGFTLLGVLDSRLPRWACLIAVALPFGAQLTAYWQGYRVEQLTVSEGGFIYTKLLRTITAKDSVIVVAGADWAAIVPFYSQRKALMIRRGLEADPVYLERAFGDLKEDDVSALIVMGPVRGNRPFLEQAASRLNLEDAPTCSVPDVDIYFSRPYAENVRVFLRSTLQFPEITLTPLAEGGRLKAVPFPISPGMARASFSNVSPAPIRGCFDYGVGHAEVDGATVLAAHPDCELWVRAPLAATRIEFDHGILPEAYTREGGRTDGVEVVVTGDTPDGRQRVIFRRVIDPLANPNDRGLQKEVIPYTPLPGEVLRFASRINQNGAYDWAYWRRIEVK